MGRPRGRAAAAFAERHWYRRSAVSLLLAPLAFAFGCLVRLRRALYRARLLRSTKLPVPVIVVGNITVGGTGKTPLVLWLAARLRAAGARPGIVSRGYGGPAAAVHEVRQDADPRDEADEALLLAQRSGSPVWAGADRAAAALGLLRAHPECDLVICDDGLQHYALARDFEVMVEDERGAGNGLLLPAGPLREPPGRRTDARVVHADRSPAPGRDAPHGALVVFMRLVPTLLYRVATGEPVEAGDLRGRRLHAAAGIGNPARFFAALERMGLFATPHVFPDHHRYSSEDLSFVGCDYVLLTEKDAVKCRHFPRSDLIAMRVEAEVDPVLARTLTERFIHGRAPA